ncbi:MAG: hypothetical protein ABH854_01800 [Candidatus Diapherotrites archaeon]
MAKCPNCGKEHNNKRYCSIECRIQHSKKISRKSNLSEILRKNMVGIVIGVFVTLLCTLWILPLYEDLFINAPLGHKLNIDCCDFETSAGKPIISAKIRNMGGYELTGIKANVSYSCFAYDKNAVMFSGGGEINPPSAVLPKGGAGALLFFDQNLVDSLRIGDNCAQYIYAEPNFGVDESGKNCWESWTAYSYYPKTGAIETKILQAPGDSIIAPICANCNLEISVQTAEGGDFNFATSWNGAYSGWIYNAYGCMSDEEVTDNIFGLSLMPAGLCASTDNNTYDYNCVFELCGKVKKKYPEVGCYPNGFMGSFPSSPLDMYTHCRNPQEIIQNSLDYSNKTSQGT